MADDPDVKPQESINPTSQPAQADRQPPPIRAEIQFPPSEMDEYKAQQRENNRLNRRNFGIQSLTLIVIVIYTSIAAYQGCQMRMATDAARKSTELLRQQLVGTQAADVALRLSIYPNNALSVIFDRRGIVAAREVRFTFRAIRKSIPSLEDIEAVINRTAYEPILSPDQIYAPKEYSLPGFTPSVMEAIRRTEQTIMVTGEFSYDNGFGNVQRHPICMYWLTGIPNRNEGEGGANGFFPCEDFAVRMSNVLKAKHEMQAN